MTIQEAKSKARLLGKGKIINIEDLAIELYRAHWEAVGVKKGMEQALEVVNHSITYATKEHDHSLYPEETGDWIDKSEVVFAIEKLSN